MFVTIIMSKQSFRDLKNEIELKNVEIDEMSMGGMQKMRKSTS